MRRRVGRLSVMAAIGIGAVTTLASYAAGLLSAAGASVAGSAMGLLSLTALIQAAADLL